MLGIALLAGLAAAKLYFHETFATRDRWVDATGSGKETGPFEVAGGKYTGDAANTGLRTTENNKFYIAAAALDEEFSNADKPLAVLLNVKFEQNIDCGGGYIKLLPKSALASLDAFTPESTYNYMFGPDICGGSKRTHVIVNYKGGNHLVRPEIRCESDELSHLYELAVFPNNTFAVKVDGKEKQRGTFEEHFDVLAPKMIDDPKVTKPADWVDEKEIDDPEDKKPEGWDDIPEKIVDPDAKKPEEWDDEEDGEWQAPLIENPDFKGEWKPKRIPNPAYKGEWVHPQIENPDYVYDPEIYKFDSFAYVGIDVWQVKAGTIYDEIVIGDDVDEVEAIAEKILARNKAEKKDYDEKKEAERKAEEERKKAEEAAKAAEEAAKAAEDAKEASEEQENKEEL